MYSNLVNSNINDSVTRKNESDANLLESKVKTIPIYSVNFQINKAERFIFPKVDPNIKTEWATKDIPDKDLFKFLINLYSDRVDQELLTEWNYLAQRNTKISEISKGGTPFTDLQTKQLTKDFKLEPPKLGKIPTKKKGKKFKDEKLAFEIFKEDETDVPISISGHSGGKETEAAENKDKPVLSSVITKDKSNITIKSINKSVNNNILGNFSTSLKDLERIVTTNKQKQYLMRFFGFYTFNPVKL